jgi:hypothetical protein
MLDVINKGRGPNRGGGVVMDGPSLAIMVIKIATKKCRVTGIKSYPYIVPKIHPYCHYSIIT